MSQSRRKHDKSMLRPLKIRDKRLKQKFAEESKYDWDMAGAVRSVKLNFCCV